MIAGGGGAGGAAGAGQAATADGKLRKTALQMEGMFVQKLFAAMRETVPTDGVMPAGGAEGTFTQLLDEQYAEAVPSQWSGQHSIAQALYEQLRQRAGGAVK